MKKIASRLLLSVLVGLSLAVTLCSGNVAADDGGSWIGTSDDSAIENSGSGGTGDSSYCEKGNPNQGYKWAMDCTGISWAFYRATEVTTEDTVFLGVPVDGSISGAGGNVTIPAECSTNAAEGGGFWHLGHNSRGAWVEVIDGQTCWGSRDPGPHNCVYTGSRGYSGHWTTITMGYPFITDRLNLNVPAHSWENTYPAQRVGVYVLDHYGSYNSEVLEAYNKARAAQGLTKATGLPSGLYAFCWYPGMGEDKTLTAYAIDSDGKAMNDGKAIDTKTVELGTSATVSADNYKPTGYDFSGSWKYYDDKTKTKNSNTFTVNSLEDDLNVYAVYKKQKRTLTLKSVDVNGVSLASKTNLENKSSQVDYNNFASVTRGANSYYTFKGFKVAGSCTKTELSAASYITRTATSNATYVSGSSSPKETYNVKNLTSNGTVCAVYEIKTYTLTAFAVSSTGVALNGGNSIDSKTVNAGTSATVGTGTFKPSGYTFSNKWQYYDDKTNTKTAASFTVDTMTQDRKVFAVYTIQNRKLTLKAVDTDGNSLSGKSGLGDVVSNVDYNTKASVTRGTNAAYTFEGFKAASSCTKTGMSGVSYTTGTSTSSATYVSGSSSPKETYNVKNLTSNGTVCAVYSINKYSLTLKSVNSFGSSLSGVKNLEDKKVPGKTYGEKVGVTRGTADGYTFRGFAKSLDNAKNGTFYTTTSTSSDYYVSGTASPKENYYVKAIKANETVYAVYDYSSFEGKSTVTSGSSSATTNWVKANKKETLFIANCSAISGCEISFNHKMRRTAGIDPVSYVVSRTSNYPALVSEKTNVNSGTFNKASNTDGYDVSNSGPFKLYPGMVVCETLSFKPDFKSGTKNIGSTVCASALGDAQPGNKTLLDLAVKNTNISAFNKEGLKEVYARPGNKIVFKPIYNPILQYTYNLKPEKMRIGSGSIIVNSNGKTLGVLFNENKGPGLSNWNNVFTVKKGSTLIGNYNQNKLGVSSIVNSSTNEYTIGNNDVGKTITETASTNASDVGKTTPKQVSFTNNNNANLATVSTGAVSSSAKVIVPYNFVNTPAVTSSQTMVYAGEKAKLNFSVTVGKRQNNTIGANYATSVKNAKAKMVIKYNGTEMYSKEVELDATLNANNNAGGVTIQMNDDKAIEVDIPDVPAGTTSRICAVAMIYPATSGSDTNTDPKGDDSWATSPEKCFTVAKKPSIQVWGGSLYTAGMINIPVAEKKTVAVNNLNLNGKTAVFGSWVEGSILANGLVGGLSSGAATGYGKTVTTLGGSLETTPNYTNRSQLNIPNTSNSSTGGFPGIDIPGGIGGSGSITPPEDKDTMISRFMTSEGSYKYRDNYTQITDLINELGTSEIPAGENQTYVINATGKTFTVNANITYQYAKYNINNMPKLIIRADNININCDVSKIDAVLIADKMNGNEMVGKVNTCADVSDKNAAGRSNQLKINGMIITGKLIAGRTYGAGTGLYSVIPAEIVDFDSTLYLWDKVDSGDGTTSTKLETVYVKELPPRF